VREGAHNRPTQANKAKNIMTTPTTEKEMTMQEALDLLLAYKKPNSPSIFDKGELDEMDDDFEDTAG
jgi:hypothetical protein